jgi:hypothetical protein
MLALILNPDVTLREPDDAERGARSFHWVGSGRAGVQTGILETLGPDFALGIGLAGEGPSLWAYAGFAPQQDARVRGTSGPGGRVWSGTVSLRGCWDFLESTPLGPCVGAELTRAAGYGIAVSNPDDAAVYWASGLLGLRAGLRLGRNVTLRVEGFGVLPAQRPSLFLEEVGRVLQPGPVGGRIHAGADVELR